MKQTIAELGIGGEGWIIYNDFILPKRVVHIEVVGNWEQDDKTLMPEYLLREHIESYGVQTTRDLVVFGNEIVYGTKEEAEEAYREEVSNTVTSDQKKDFYTFIKKLKNIAEPQPDSTDWNQVRINAAISILSSLLETTKLSEDKEVYAKNAVAYADSLVKELKRSEALFEAEIDIKECETCGARDCCEHNLEKMEDNEQHINITPSDDDLGSPWRKHILDNY